MKKYLYSLLILAILLALVAFPAIATPFFSSSLDGDISDYSGTSYATVQNRVTGSFVESTNTTAWLGQEYTGVYWWIYRSYLFFDTSAIPVGSNITSVTLYLYGSSDYTVTDFNITIVNGQPTYPHSPLVATDYSSGNYTVGGGSLTTVGWNTSGYNAVSFNSTGLSYINRGGITKLCLRSSRDISSTPPTGNEFLSYYTSEYGTDRAPYLSIISSPSITTLPASNIAKTSARLNAYVTDDGGESCNVSFGYGKASRTSANFTGYDTVTAWTTGWDTGEAPYYDATSLNSTTLYYYRARIINSAGNVTGDELTFTTLATVGDISNFSGIPSATYNSLNWIRGAGGTNTLVKYALDVFPVNTGNGTLVYFGNNFTYDHTGLTSGHTYFYSAWGESGGEYSLHAVNLALTTLASTVAGDTFDAPTTPTGWFQIPDPTALSGLEPFYTLINYVADDWGMTRGTFWLGGFLILCFLIGLALYIKFHAPALALVIVMMLMIAGVRFTILPSFMLFIVAIMAIGAWSLRPYQT